MARVEVITGPERRRRWSEEQKRAIVVANLAPGAVVSEAARRADVGPGQIYRWRKELRAVADGFAQVLIAPAKRGGNRRHVDERAIANGLMYILSTGCQWRALPKDLPPRSTVHDYFDLWSWDGTLDRIHHELYLKCREEAGREASPTAAIIDSQSVKSAEKGGARSIRTGMTRARKSRARSAISW